jgi:hypothetical protein
MLVGLVLEGAKTATSGRDRTIVSSAALSAHGGDNKPVANVADGCRRIEPGQIVSGTVRESTARLWLLRLAVGIVASFITLIATVDFLGLWVFLTSIVVGAVTAWAANGRRLLQLGAAMAAFWL